MRVEGSYQLIAQASTNKPEEKKEKIETPKSVMPTFEEKKLTRIELDYGYESGGRKVQISLKEKENVLVELTPGGSAGCGGHSGPNGGMQGAGYPGSAGVIARASDRVEYKGAVKIQLDAFEQYLKDNVKKLTYEENKKLQETKKQLIEYYKSL